jgi:hypothetical protein
MARYFNKTRSPLTAPLRDRSTGYFASKQWVTLTKEQEGTAAVVHLVKKGMLIRREAKVIRPSLPVALQAPPEVEPSKPVPPPPAVVEIPAPAVVHVDTTIEATIEAEEVSEDVDPTSLIDEVDENAVASEDGTDTESKTTRRSKARRR